MAYSNINIYWGLTDKGMSYILGGFATGKDLYDRDMEILEAMGTGKIPGELDPKGMPTKEKDVQHILEGVTDRELRSLARRGLIEKQGFLWNEN